MGQWSAISVVNTIPAANTEPGITPYILLDGNALEIRGRASAGTNKLYLMRKFVTPGDANSYQWQPCFDDKAMNPSLNADVNGWFWDRFWLPDQPRGEAFALLNPGGGLTFAVAPMVRSLRY